MGERVSDTVTIRASAAQIMDVILDLESYPEWAEGMKDARVTQRDDQGRPVLCHFRVDARVAEIDYTLRYHHDGDDLTWDLEEGDVVRQLDGRYHLEEGEDATDVEYSLEVDITLPVPGFLKKRAAKTILDTSLRGLKKRVEART